MKKKSNSEAGKNLAKILIYLFFLMQRVWQNKLNYLEINTYTGYIYRYGHSPEHPHVFHSSYTSEQSWIGCPNRSFTLLCRLHKYSINYFLVLPSKRPYFFRSSMKWLAQSLQGYICPKRTRKVLNFFTKKGGMFSGNPPVTMWSKVQLFLPSYCLEIWCCPTSNIFFDVSACYSSISSAESFQKSISS